MTRAEWDSAFYQLWHSLMYDFDVPYAKAQKQALEKMQAQYGPRPAAAPKLEQPGKSRGSWLSIGSLLKLAGLAFSLRKVASMQFNKAALIQAAIAGIVAAAATLGVANSDAIVSASEMLNIAITFFSVAFSALMNPAKPKPPVS